MPKYRIAAVVLGGLFLASPVMAQSTHLAYATGEPRSEYMVFLEKGNVLPESAVPMVSKATKAAKAAKKGTGGDGAGSGPGTGPGEDDDEKADDQFEELD